MNEWPISIQYNTFFSYEIYSGGELRKKKVTNDSDELQYWLFEGTTFYMVCGFEIKN